MTKESTENFVVAEMNTHHFMFRGAGKNRDRARLALLNAWQSHRTALLQRYPERADSIPDECNVENHFRIYYLEFEADAGYRDGERIA